MRKWLGLYFEGFFWKIMSNKVGREKGLGFEGSGSLFEFDVTGNIGRY